MSNQIYYGTCPKHGGRLTTETTKTIRSKDTGKKYTKPLFFCKRCNAFYMFVDEFRADFRRTIHTGPGALPVHVCGKATYIVETVRRPAKQQTAKGENLTKKPYDRKTEITRDTEDGILTINIIADGTKIPKKCLCCGDVTANLTLLAKNANGKEKKLLGKECPHCGEIYYPESIYQKHSSYFRLANSAGKNQPEVKAKDSISDNAKNLVLRYLQCKKKSETNQLRKMLIDIDEDIDLYLKEQLSGITKEQAEKILKVGIRRVPRLFLLDYLETFKSDPNQINALDFSNREYREAAISLIGILTPYPRIVLKKLSSDIEAQFRIRGELKKGNIYLYYIEFISNNKEILREEWLQQIIRQIISKRDIGDNFWKYIDFNTDEGIKLLNSVEDLTMIYHLLKSNYIGLDRKTLIKANERVTAVHRAVYEGIIVEILQKYLDTVEISAEVLSYSKSNPSYAISLLEFAKLKQDVSLLERIVSALGQNGIIHNKFESILVSQGSEYYLDLLLGRIVNADYSQKHALAKKILLTYPEKASRLIQLVESSGDETFIRNVRKMAETLKVPWVVEISDKEVSYEEKGQTVSENLNYFIELKNEDRSIRQTLCNGMYMDDFGREFDFSDLAEFLFL